MNRAVFEWVNGWPDFFTPFFTLWSDGNKWWPVRILLLIVAVAMLWRAPRTRICLLLVLISVGISNELTDFIKATWPQLRPCVELDQLNLRTGMLTSFGTASAHSANMAAVAVVFARRLGRWGWIWAAVAFFTGTSRIYLGVHYPDQVLLGWLCGALVSLIVTEVYRQFELRREITDSGALNSSPEPGSHP